MFPDLGEFRLVQKILDGSVKMKEQGPAFRNWLNAGDDAAIFDGWLATKDLSVEGTHFRMDWSTPEQAVEKHIVSNISDISAMGGRPRLALFGLCVNKSWSAEVRERVTRAVAEGFARRGIALIGGDTVAADNVGMFSTTLLGVQAGPKPLLRSDAKPGDSIYVAGTLGKSAAGLWILMNHPELAAEYPDLVAYHLSPKIHEEAGAVLAEIETGAVLAEMESGAVPAGAVLPSIEASAVPGAVLPENRRIGACMDISDGLSSELNHLSISSQVKMVVEESAIPVDEGVKALCSRFGLNPLEFALNGGEEYELLFTSPEKNDIFQGKQSLLGNVYRVGQVQEGSGVFIHKISGSEENILAQAWSHL